MKLFSCNYVLSFCLYHLSCHGLSWRFSIAGVCCGRLWVSIGWLWVSIGRCWVSIGRLWFSIGRLWVSIHRLWVSNGRWLPAIIKHGRERGNIFIILWPLGASSDTKKHDVKHREQPLSDECLCVWWSPDDGEVTGVLPGDVPGVSQRLPQIILLRRGLLTEEEDTLRLKERSHDRWWEILVTVLHYLHTHTHTLDKKQHVHIQTDRQASHQVQYREQTVCEFSSAGVFNLSIQIGLMDRLFDIIIII